MDKRGVSPLIATLLLIVLAVALGVLVMNFGRAQIEETAQCAVHVGLAVVSLNNQPQICFDQDKKQIYFIIENGPNIAVEGIKTRIIGSKEVYSTDINGPIERLGTLMKYLSYDSQSYGEIKQIRMTPIVSLYNEEILCDQQSLTIENVRLCEK